jgi:hypothetical protein
MLTLRLVPAPTGSATLPAGGSLPRGRAFRSRLTTPRKTLALKLGQYAPLVLPDYDALMIGPYDLRIGSVRLSAIPE